MHHRLSPALRQIAVALFHLSAFIFHISLFNLPLSAQRPPQQPHAAEILHRMQKLNVLGSVLYIAAHPDDENTRMIAWLANGKKVRTGYLSLTRGEGGQNLIGPELGDALGIIRTQELLEARRIDGGEQFFTRAVDFGYSKSATESFEKWGKEEVLSDVVRVIRMFRPDVIISRFAPDRSAGHGHHEASAILAEEAFDLAGDPKAFPEQLEQGLEVWQPRRLFFNGSTWWNRDLATIAASDPDWFSVDVGGYDPLLGLSYTEIAGRSRSMHKSQGFGAAETRGESLEYLKLVKGDRPKTEDIFEGIDMTWGRIVGGMLMQVQVDSLLAGLKPTEPHLIKGMLWRTRDILDSIKFSVHYPEGLFESLTWSRYASIKFSELIPAVTGTVFEAIADQYMIAVHDSLRIRNIILSRLPSGAEISSRLRVDQAAYDVIDKDSKNSDPVTATIKIGDHIDEPHWLSPRTGNLHDIRPRSIIGFPALNGSLLNEVRMKGLSELGTFHIYGIIYKWVDRVAGERIRPVYVTPVASVIPKTDVLIATGGSQSITVEVEALTDSLTGNIEVTVPEGWSIAPYEEAFTIPGVPGRSGAVTVGSVKKIASPRVDNVGKTTQFLSTPTLPLMRNERQSFNFQLTPGDNAQVGAVKFAFSGPKGKADRTLHEIDYPHIMPQVYYTPAEVKLVPLDVKTTAKRVGYVKGAGDDVPQAMEQLGVVVEFIEPGTAKLDELQKYDAIVTGIRAYNATKGMKELHPLLLRYVEEGGTLIVQYNTTPRFFSGATDFQIDPSTLGPHPFSISRGRVTVEEAPPTFLDPKHPLLNTPNKITAADFEGWVQERGLYFADEFAPHYTPLIAWNDPGEEPLNGALIVADHGKGRFVYTGISFFRQLPAGVGGAYRLWANLISPREVKNE